MSTKIGVFKHLPTLSPHLTIVLESCGQDIQESESMNHSSGRGFTCPSLTKCIKKLLKRNHTCNTMPFSHSVMSQLLENKIFVFVKIRVQSWRKPRNMLQLSFVFLFSPSNQGCRFHNKNTECSTIKVCYTLTLKKYLVLSEFQIQLVYLYYVKVIKCLNKVNNCHGSGT